MARVKHFEGDTDTPGAVMGLGYMLGLRVQHANRPVAKEGSRTVHLKRPLRDPETGDVVATVGFGHRTLFWREA